jgi:hypothetical protein
MGMIDDIERWLAAAMLTAAVGLVPAAALAAADDDTSGDPGPAATDLVVSHQAIETRSAGAASTTAGAKGVSDHEALQTRTAGATTDARGASEERIVPDHAEAERGSQ